MYLVKSPVNFSDGPAMYGVCFVLYMCFVPFVFQIWCF